MARPRRSKTRPVPRCTGRHIPEGGVLAGTDHGARTVPVGGETGGQRGAAQGRRRPGGQPRRRASASTSTRRAFPPTVQQVRQRGCPCWNRPFRSPQILAAAQPLPLINHCRGAAATVDDADGTARRRPYAAACPCCLSRARRRPHPAEPAAVQPRRDRAVQGSARRDARQRALDVRGFGVAGLSRSVGRGDRRPRWTAGGRRCLR